MKAFKEFRREDKSFWFFIRFISEKLRYSRNGIYLEIKRRDLLEEY